MKGIYKITSPSGKVYIGQSWDLERRFKHYKYLAQMQTQRKLHASFVKHGVDSHSFEVVHELPADVEQEVLDRYEQLYMDWYKDAGFELMNIRGGGNGPGQHSEETKRRIGAKHKGHHRLAGIKQAPEFIKKRMAALAPKLERPVLQINQNGELVSEYPSIKAAAVALNLVSNNIGKVAKGDTNRKLCGGFKWQYKN